MLPIFDKRTTNFTQFVMLINCCKKYLLILCQQIGCRNRIKFAVLILFYIHKSCLIFFEKIYFNIYLKVTLNSLSTLQPITGFSLYKSVLPCVTVLRHYNSLGFLPIVPFALISICPYDVLPVFSF